MSAAAPVLAVSCQVNVRVLRLPHGEDLPLPAYATPQSSGMDLYAALSEAVIVQPLQRALIPCGIALELPEGFEAQIRPRSGLALKHGLTVANAPGTVDADYRGEIKALMINLSDEPCLIEPGQRIAQMVIARCERAVLTLAETLGESERGAGGFGSTGIEALELVEA